ncbi:MAG TPA: hypothetical protein VNH18_09105, partial [Bryobacteraceae bacterium]|nr:hypothetical protein [Bryobacteraceae bacterium]
MKRAGWLLLLLVQSHPAQLRAAETAPGWWMTEPIRWVQTNLRQTDANLDAPRLVAQLSDMRANVLLLGMGGIVAYYHPTTPFHYASPDLPAGRDMFGEVLTTAHSRRIRVVGRFDFSKTQKAVFDAHPEWFFRQANGEPVIYNGLYSTCINGGYYREQAMKILAEGLERYDVDGLFFNMFGNQSRDYSGREVGLCHCDECARRYRAQFHKELPTRPDDDYRRFMFTASREVAAAIGDLIHQKRPKAGYFNYIQEATDGIMSESNTAVERTAWPYSASDNVNRARNSEPSKMAVNLNMQFVDMWWRFATVPTQEIASRMWQNIANGGALTFEVNGTLDQQDKQAVNTARPIFQWVAQNERYYAGQQSAARVLLLGASQKTGRTYPVEPYRGAFRLLSEEHIPFAVSDNTDSLSTKNFDLVVATSWAPPELKQFAEAGGKVLILSAQPPDFPAAQVVRTMPDVRGYIRVRDHALFPSLKDTDLVMLNGAFTELRATGTSPLTLIPPSMIGPPEFVHIDQKDTETPGVVIQPMGKGTVAWVPWDLAGLYYHHSLPAHAGVFRDLVDRLLPDRQLRTHAHPLVETTLMKQGGHTMVHLVNLSGTSQGGYHEPVPMNTIRIQVRGTFRSA